MLGSGFRVQGSGLWLRIGIEGLGFTLSCLSRMENVTCVLHLSCVSIQRFCFLSFITLSLELSDTHVYEP